MLNQNQAVTRTEAKNAFYELRRQASDIQEMSLDEINAEIMAVRKERTSEQPCANRNRTFLPQFYTMVSHKENR